MNKCMKKILVSLIFLNIIHINAYASELEDCSIYSKINPKYLACKAANFAKDAKNFQKKQWSKELEKIKKKD